MNGLKVMDIMSKDTVTAGPSESITELIKKLLKFDVGAVVIVNDEMKPLGIAARSDIFECIIKEPVKYLEMIADNIMKRDFISVDPGLDVVSANDIMQINLINRLPVVSNNRLVGMITHREINNILREQFEILEISHRDLEEKMKIDFLTGVYNRAYVDKKLIQYIDIADRTNAPFTLILVDIDNFKGINDTYGHICGDMILKSAARLFIEKSRNISIVGRFGGDEFIIIVPYSDTNSSLYMAERLRMSLEETDFNYNGINIRVTASFGLVAWSKGIKSCQEIIKNADNCLYYAKRNGKNRVSVFGGLLSENSSAISASGNTLM